MPDGSPMFVWHNDEVRANHPDMVILAASADCPNQVWRWRDQPIWGVQGHLEISLVHAPAWFADCREVMISDGADVDALLANAVEQTAAQTILQRFAAYITHPTPISK
jgi:GMP synthase (glutamine-hydrolysing)